jgi:hypothetical protein
MENSRKRPQRDLLGIALSEYAYVSLFGLDSIQELKLNILQNTVASSKVGDFINDEALRDKLDRAEGPAKRTFLWAAKAIAGNRFESVLAALSATTARQIVVLDDLERKGACSR